MLHQFWQFLYFRLFNCLLLLMLNYYWKQHNNLLTHKFINTACLHFHSSIFESSSSFTSWYFKLCVSLQPPNYNPLALVGICILWIFFLSVNRIFIHMVCALLGNFLNFNLFVNLPLLSGYVSFSNIVCISFAPLNSKYHLSVQWIIHKCLVKSWNTIPGMLFFQN